jgi:hypothetical protein
MTKGDIEDQILSILFLLSDKDDGTSEVRKPLLDR